MRRLVGSSVSTAAPVVEAAPVRRLVGSSVSTVALVVEAAPVRRLVGSSSAEAAPVRLPSWELLRQGPRRCVAQFGSLAVRRPVWKCLCVV